MKKYVLLLVLLGLLAAATGFTQAQQTTFNIGPRDFGFGFVFGEPTGISAKLWIGRVTALDLTAAWSFAREGRLILQMDYLFHYFGLFRLQGRGQLPIYLGIGPRLALTTDNPHLGARVPLGVSYLFPTIPIELFVEIAPGMEIIPATQFDFSGGFGLRYYF